MNSAAVSLCLPGYWTCLWPPTWSRSRMWSTSSSTLAETLRVETSPGSTSEKSGTSSTLGESPSVRRSVGRSVRVEDVERDPVNSVSLSLCSYGEALFMNSKLIGGVTEFLNTEKELNEVKTHKHTSLVSLWFAGSYMGLANWANPTSMLQLTYYNWYNYLDHRTNQTVERFGTNTALHHWILLS